MGLKVDNFWDGTYSLDLHPAILDDSTSSSVNGEVRLYLSGRKELQQVWPPDFGDQTTLRSSEIFRPSEKLPRWW
jgi:hypothetical protein